MRLHEAGKDYLARRRRLLAVIYAGDANFRDSGTALVKMLLKPSSRFAASADLTPLVVVGPGEEPLATAVLIHAHRMPDTLQVSFFEALPDQWQAVDGLVDRARAMAVRKGCRRVVFGLEGHVNNGLGYVVDRPGHTACFGAPYNPPYYPDYFARYATSTRTMVSYAYDLAERNLDHERRAIKRVARRYAVRHGRFHDLRAEMEVYTRLNNESFRDHPFYFERTVDEDLELFAAFRPFLRPENFLVCEDEGRPIGFLLWYPDFHELLGPGEGLGWRSVLKYRLPGHAISRFKVTEFGMLPAYQGTGAVFTLIAHCFELARKHGYRWAESGWIFEDNAKSIGVSTRWAAEPHETYKVFEMAVEVPPA